MRRSIPRIVCVMLTLLLAGEELFATDVGGLICTNTTWTAAGSPYIVIGSSGIVIGCNATLTIEPGLVVKFNPTLAIVVGSAAFGKGTLVARGTAESPIVFTSVKANNPLDPAKPGDWSRIHFTDYAVDATFDSNDNYISGGILEHVIVEYAGYGDPGTNYGAIFAEKSSPFLNYCEVRHNAFYGIVVDDTGAPRINITNCEVWDHPQRGIYISGGPGSNRLIYNNIHDNRGGGIYFGSAGSNILIGNTITANTSGDGICFESSGGNIITRNTISGNTGGGIGFNSAGSNTLAENTISGNTGTGIGFTWAGSNTLTENTITNNTGGGICFDYDSGSNTVSGNTITNNTAGGPGGGIYFGWSSSNTLTRNTITGNTASGAGGGICFDVFWAGWGGCPASGGNTLTQNTITNNTAGSSGGGIWFCGSPSNTLRGNTIMDNTSSGDGGGICFAAHYCSGWSGSNTISGNTITGNTTAGAGGGLYLGYSGSNTLARNTITGNTASGAGGGIYLGYSGSNTLTRNVVQSNLSRNGLGVVYLDASGDTTFSQNTITDNYIETGTTGGIYVTNSERVSLAGDPNAHTYNIIQDNDGYWVYNNNTFNADGRNDVNAVYVQWGTCDIPQIMDGIFDYFDDGSKAFVLFYPFVIPGDFDFDEDVDLPDLATFVDNWLRQDCIIPDWCEGADLDVNTTVDFFDFARFGEYWVECAGP